MEITLKAHFDQFGAARGDINSSTWQLCIDGNPFPNGADSLISLTTAHRALLALMDLEELIAADSDIEPPTL